MPGNTNRNGQTGRFTHAGDPRVRFWSKVKKGRGCWEWQAGLGQGGYGAFWWDGKTGTAHRFSYIIHFGMPLPGLQICHTCDNVRCVRPSHLFTGTHLTNKVDCVKKGRQARGENIGCGVLTSDKVLTIRELHVATDITMAELARQNGVTPRSIHLIIRRETWKHI